MFSRAIRGIRSCSLGLASGASSMASSSSAVCSRSNPAALNNSLRNAFAAATASAPAHQLTASRTFMQATNSITRPAMSASASTPVGTSTSAMNNGANAFKFHNCLTITRGLNRNARRPKRANHGKRPVSHARKRAKAKTLKSRLYREKIFGFW